VTLTLIKGLFGGNAVPMNPTNVWGPKRFSPLCHQTEKGGKNWGFSPLWTNIFTKTMLFPNNKKTGCWGTKKSFPQKAKQGKGQKTFNKRWVVCKLCQNAPGHLGVQRGTGVPTRNREDSSKAVSTDLKKKNGKTGKKAKTV